MLWPRIVFGVSSSWRTIHIIHTHQSTFRALRMYCHMVITGAMVPHNTERLTGSFFYVVQDTADVNPHIIRGLVPAPTAPHSALSRSNRWRARTDGAGAHMGRPGLVCSAGSSRRSAENSACTSTHARAESTGTHPSISTSRSE